MSKNNRALKYNRRVQILISEQQYLFLEGLNGGICSFIRKIIDEKMDRGKEIITLEQEIKNLEDRIDNMKKNSKI